MKLILVLSLLFGIFNFMSPKGNNEVEDASLDEVVEDVVETRLLDEDEEEYTENEILDFLFERYYNEAYRSPFSMYIDLFYSTNLEEETLGSILFESDTPYEDAMGYYNYGYHLVTPKTLTFEKNKIYLFRDFVDSDNKNGAPLFYLSKCFEVIYEVKMSDIFRYSSLNYDEFSEDNFEYEDYSDDEQNMMRIINNRLNELFDDLTRYEEIFVLYPKEDITLTKKNNIEMSEFGWRYSWSSVDEDAENFNDSDYGYRITCLDYNGSVAYAEFDSPSFVVDVDDLVPYEDIIAQVTATDPTDGDLTEDIEFSDNTYILDEDGHIAVGTYSFKATVADNFGNTTSQTFNVIVADVQAPVLNTRELKYRYSRNLTEEQIFEALNITDNYYSKEDIAWEFVINKYETAPLVKNYKTVGRYQMRIKLTDPSNNSCEYEFPIIVFDDVAPIVTAPQIIISTTTHKLTLEEIKAKTTAVDQYCSVLQTYIVADYENYKTSNTPKDYRFGLYAEDLYSNSVELQFYVRLVDDDLPVFEISDERLIIVNSNEKLTQDYIVKLLIPEEELDNLILEEVESNYFDQDSVDGASYNVVVRGYDKRTNEEVEYKGVINIADNNKASSPKTITETDNNFFLNVWEENKILIIILGSAVLLFFALIIFSIAKRSKKKVTK